MKILAISDPHYPACVENLPSLEEAIRKEKPDAFVIAGDISRFDDKLYDEFLSRFKQFDMTKVAIAGNTDLYTEKESSLERHARLGQLLRANGFHYLDESPIIIDGVGFVGGVGWFDYSLAHKDSKSEQMVPIRGTRKRVKDFTTEDYDAWDDTRFLKWNHTNGSFLEYCLQKLKKDLANVKDDKKIVAVIHYLPFENMVPREELNTSFAVNNAYTGSKKLGEPLLADPRVKVLISGHTHVPGYWKNGHIDCYNVSARYGDLHPTIIRV